MLRFRGSIFLMFGVLALVLLQCCGHGSSASTTVDQIDNNTRNPRKPHGEFFSNVFWNSMMIKGHTNPTTPSTPSKCRIEHR